MFTNDNGSTMRSETPQGPGAHGQAALLLVESLIHGLCENEILDTKQAIDIAKRAAEVQADQADAADGDGAPMRQAHQLLTAIAQSLRVDADQSPS